jgi:hypothetical protein
MTPVHDLDERAIGILRANDRGGFTVPTARLYPYQWNWDSAFAALGFSTFDLDRAWTEIEMLFEGQWPDGMVPHIIFRRDDADYFPGPAVWGTGTTPPTSGHSQPPVAATMVRALHERDPGRGAQRLRALFPKLLAWHRWFHSARDPEGRGVIGVVHPWESGRDNSPDWDAAMANIEPTAANTYVRRDTGHVDPSMRPTQSDYDRYMSIVAFGRSCGWDPERLYREGPFFAADPGITFILLRADRDLLALAESLGIDDGQAELVEWIGRAEDGANDLWSDPCGGYVARDLKTGEMADNLSSVAFLAWYAGLADETRAGVLAANLQRIVDALPFAVPSLDPAHSKFDRLRYWRGPVWGVINYLIGRGLAETGHRALATRLRNDTRRMIEISGFYEYYDPLSGTGAGGASFTWTAAIWLAWATPSVSTA